jgi:hypothetical protein
MGAHESAYGGVNTMPEMSFRRVSRMAPFRAGFMPRTRQIWPFLVSVPWSLQMVASGAVALVVRGAAHSIQKSDGKTRMECAKKRKKHP